MFIRSFRISHGVTSNSLILNTFPFYHANLQYFFIVLAENLINYLEENDCI